MAGKIQRAGTLPGRPHTHVVRGTNVKVQRVVVYPGRHKRWMRGDGSFVPNEQVEVRWK